jgi:hypothetical protein
LRYLVALNEGSHHLEDLVPAVGILVINHPQEEGEEEELTIKVDHLWRESLDKRLQSREEMHSILSSFITEILEHEIYVLLNPLILQGVFEQELNEDC